PDGRLVSAGDDGTVRVWDLKDLSTGPVSCDADEGATLALRFTEDGHSLVSGHQSGALCIWTYGMSDLLGVAARKSGRNPSQEEWEQYFLAAPYRATFEAFPGVDGGQSIPRSHATKNDETSGRDDNP